ncbi:NO-associated protein 1, chloroplastic/mitochondrial isoform X3 [Beta vulgaris subsp. vulgaris]|uniref:NO-associated protein 1, chloroplastic/mitochondrial isoform X3 n=1 Tax=Beta vulgaris subsp. vulgaris TaxID=3555 RepID=UPI002036F609|nr:NO-associated protein 1, chloroplastic/mitochondrial isoform X3 [Beta vulgaris subsp. vulgaris]
MPPKSLSIFSYLPYLPHQLQNPFSNSHLHFKTQLPKFSLIKCRATTTSPNPNPELHGTPQNIATQVPVSEPDTDTEGSGAAAPTRGQLFLEHHQAKVASKLLLAANKKKRKKKEKETGSFKPINQVAGCYGCGAPLQTQELDAPGYVDSDTYELKKKHRQLKTILCGRCRLLSHGHMITAVGGHGGYAGGKQFVTAEELRDKLSHLRHEKALIVKLVDIIDFNGSFLSRVRDLTGANPIILVVTKIDLLPKGTDMNCIGDWIVEATTKKKLNVVSVHLTSSKSMVGITGVVAEIQEEKKGRDVYILGSANVGKSAFINALLMMMGENDPMAAAAQKYKPIQSAVPGTTLGPIPIDAFFGGGKLYDTPGVHLHHRQGAVVPVDDLPVLAPRSRLKGRSFPKEIGLLLTPPAGKERTKSWNGLETERRLQLRFDDLDRPCSDIAISGLGWIAVEPINKELVMSDVIPELTNNELHFSVHVPKPVEIFVRSPLPVGKAGSEWYEYRDLTEQEEETRPKWHY